VAETDGAARTSAPATQAAHDARAQLALLDDFGDEAGGQRLLGGQRAAGENQIHRPLRPDERRQQHGRHRREAGQLDFRLAEARRARGQDEIADTCELHASAQAVAAHGGDRNPVRLPELPEDAVEGAEHPRHAVGRVVADLDPGREGFLAGPGENQEAHGGRSRQRLEHAVQFLERGEVEHVHRWAVERQPRHRAGALELDARGFSHSACVVAFLVSTQAPSWKSTLSAARSVSPGSTSCRCFS